MWYKSGPQTLPWSSGAVNVCSSSDTSTVKQLQHVPKVSIDNTAYLGHDGGTQCGTKAARRRYPGAVGAVDISSSSDASTVKQLQHAPRGFDQ